ncbi:MAG: molybdenum cofactor biosynthesis protein B [Candidatus Bathyarchaeia archaeon]
MGSEEHKLKAPKTLKFALVTCSSSRFESFKQGKPFRDESGDLAEQIIKSAGFSISYRTLISDDSTMIKQTIEELCSKSDVDVVVLSGGTGLSPKDVTIEAVSPMFEKEVPGFGELFRMLTFQEEGSVAILTRATAGVYKGKVVFVLPGSPKAVKLAFERLIIPEAAHMVLHVKGLG